MCYMDQPKAPQQAAAQDKYQEMVQRMKLDAQLMELEKREAVKRAAAEHAAAEKKAKAEIDRDFLIKLLTPDQMYEYIKHLQSRG